MPPLRSSPEVLLVETQVELDVQFDAFLNGDNQYQHLTTTDDTSREFHVFIPRGREYIEGIFGLMMDGHASGAAVTGEIFPSPEEYERIRGNRKAPILELAQPIPEAPIRNRRSLAANKITQALRRKYK